MNVVLTGSDVDIAQKALEMYIALHLGRYRDISNPSWNTKGRKKAWWEYLFWEPDPFSDMPLKLAWKYWDDPRIDAEIRRRLEWAEQMRREKNQQESGHE